MTDTELLGALKVDLGITSEAYDERLVQIIHAAEKEIEKEGATLDLTDIDHVETVVMYAGWLWNRRTSQTGMPRMVRYQLNNLIFHQHNKE